MIATSKSVAYRQRTLFPDDRETEETVRRHEFIRADELRFLDALCKSDEVTMDDAVDDLSAKFKDGGRWRGSIPLRLARDGLIVRVGATNSRREHRHRGLLRVWRIGNRTVVEARRLALRAMLAALDSGQETDRL